MSANIRFMDVHAGPEKVPTLWSVRFSSESLYFLIHTPNKTKLAT